jgi:hypothetical protein
MYQRKDYTAKEYRDLITWKREKIISFKGGSDNEKREFFDSLGIENILIGSKWKLLSECFGLQFDRAIDILRREVDKYLEKYSSKYEEDLLSGSVSVETAGEQMSLEFEKSEHFWDNSGRRDNLGDPPFPEVTRIKRD